MTDKERQYASILKRLGVRYTYNKRRFPLGKTTYRPDFYLPGLFTYVEVVGSLSAYKKNEAKYKLFRKAYPSVKFIIRDFNNKEFDGIHEVPGLKRLTVEIDEELKHLFFMKAVAHRRTVTDILTQLLKEWIKTEGISRKAKSNGPSTKN